MTCQLFYRKRLKLLLVCLIDLQDLFGQSQDPSSKLIYSSGDFFPEVYRFLLNHTRDNQMRGLAEL